MSPSLLNSLCMSLSSAALINTSSLMLSAIFVSITGVISTESVITGSVLTVSSLESILACLAFNRERIEVINVFLGIESEVDVTGVLVVEKRLNDDVVCAVYRME